MNDYDIPQEAAGGGFPVTQQGFAAPNTLSAADTCAESVELGGNTASIDFGKENGFMEEDSGIQADGYTGESSSIGADHYPGTDGFPRADNGADTNGRADEADPMNEEEFVGEAEILQPEMETEDFSAAGNAAAQAPEEAVFRLAYHGGEIPLSASQLEAAARRGLDYAREQIQTQQRTKPYFDLIERYPELREAKNMPREVLAESGGGAAPLAAYQAYLLRQMQARQAVLQQKQAAKQKCTGSAAAQFSDAPGTLDAFDAVFYE